MFKLVADEVWAFDAEWVPDPDSGRRVYGLPETMPDDEVRAHMWAQGGATEEDPQPFLKTVLCRVVSIAAVVRRRSADGGVVLRIHALPQPASMDTSEAEILTRFLAGIGKARPQLVGFNSQASDLVILVQRALANGLRLPDFCRRPAKPWEGADYFARGSDYHVDLKDVFGAWGKGTPSLHELATVSGIPGKLGVDGNAVADLWQQGRIGEIVAYNECDALTTYLVWLRAAHLAGFLTTEQYEEEQGELETLLEKRVAGTEAAHLVAYLDAWRALRR